MTHFARRPIVALLFLTLAGTRAPALSWSDTLVSPPSLHAVAAGMVASSLDPHGQIVNLAWPGSGGTSQTPSPLPVPAKHNAGEWGVSLGNEVVWLSDGAWTTNAALPRSPREPGLTLTFTAPSLKTAATLSIAVSPMLPVLCARLQVEGDLAPDGFIWYQKFRPFPPDSPVLPFYGVHRMDTPGFATFFDSNKGRLYQFRPTQSGRADWDHALRLLSSGGTASEWSSFPDGAWCATSLSGTGLSCEFETSHPTDKGAQAAIGPAAALLKVKSEGLPRAGTATLFVAFGPNRTQVDAALDQAMQQGFDTIHSAMQQDYTSRLAPADRLLSPSSPFRTRFEQDLHALCSAIDSATGIVLGIPFGDPGLPTTWPELAAWTSLAFHLTGLSDLSQRQLALFHDILPAAGGHTATPAILPALVRADGKPATPSFIHNPADAAWLVLAAVQQVRHLPPEAAGPAAAAFHTQLVTPVLRHLRRWANPATGGPPPGFDPVRLRDAGGVGNELLYYLGVAGALEIAGLAKAIPDPSWQTWRRDLEALLRFRMVNEREGWQLSPYLAAWAAMSLDERDPLCEAPVRTADGMVRLSQCPIPTLSGQPSNTTPNALAAAADLIAIFTMPPH